MLWKHFSFLSSDCNNNLKLKSELCFRPYIRISPYCSEVNVIKSNKTPYNHLDIFYHHPMTKKILLFSIKKKQRKRTKPRCLYITTNIYINVLDIYLQLLETFAFVDQTCIRLYTSINLRKLKFLQHFSRKWTFNLQLHVN